MIYQGKNNWYAEASHKALSIIEAGIEAVKPHSLIRKYISYNAVSGLLTVNGHVHDAAGRRIFILGAGKAAPAMAAELEALIGPQRIRGGAVIGLPEGDCCQRIELLKGNHPNPGHDSVASTKTMLSLKENYAIGENDIILFLISGGGSSLMCLPHEDVGLNAFVKVNKLLLASGAPIDEINIVRKHLSQVKGGRLAEHFYPAEMIALMISDVPGDNGGTIASGPTVTDNTGKKDALRILEKWDIIKDTPKEVLAHLKSAERSPVNHSNGLCENHIMANVKTAEMAMGEKATELGYVPFILEDYLSDQPEDAAKTIFDLVTVGDINGANALIFGGETTPVVPKYHGLGGRNQHLALSFAAIAADWGEKWVMATAATDGCDYMPEAMGAIVDSQFPVEVVARGLDMSEYLRRYDSYTILSELGRIIPGRRTGTNTADIGVLLLE